MVSTQPLLTSQILQGKFSTQTNNGSGPPADQQFKSVYNISGAPQEMMAGQSMMPNTTYEQPIGLKANPYASANADSLSVAGSEKMRKFKKYGLKDYQNLQSTIQNSKMGGLGPNIGSEQWEAAKRKKEIAMQYSNNLKQMNAHVHKGRIKSGTSSHLAVPNEKDAKSVREKALDFAKNVPRPKQRKASPGGSEGDTELAQGHATQIPVSMYVQ